MFAYIKFSELKPPGNKKVVPTSDIKRFVPAEWNTRKQYKVKNGDVYSDAIVLLVEEDKAKLQEKIQNKRIVIPPAKHLMSASETSMDESAIPRASVGGRVKTKILGNLDNRLKQLKAGRLTNSKDITTENTINRKQTIIAKDFERILHNKRGPEDVFEGQSGPKSPLQDIQNVAQVSGLRKKAKKSHEQDVRTNDKIVSSVGEKENRHADTTVTQVGKQPDEPNIMNILKIKQQHASNTTGLTGAVQHPKSALQKESHQSCNQKNTSLQQKCNRLELQLQSLQQRMQQQSDEHSRQHREWCESLNSMQKKQEAMLEHVKVKENELESLRRLNRELQESAINHFDQINATITAMKSKGKISFTDCEPPVGYVRKDDKVIHLGRGQWISTDTYAMAVSNARTPSMFVRNMAVAVFGFDTLLGGTVSGFGSNRNQRAQIPKDKLNPIQILAIKDIFRHWMLKEIKMSENDADIEVERTRKYISKKIADLKIQSKSKASADDPESDRVQNVQVEDEEDVDSSEEINEEIGGSQSEEEFDEAGQSSEKEMDKKTEETEVLDSEEIVQQLLTDSEEDMFTQGSPEMFSPVENECSESPDSGLSQVEMGFVANGTNDQFIDQDFDSMAVSIGTPDDSEK